VNSYRYASSIAVISVCYTTRVHSTEETLLVTRGDEPICYRGPLCQLPLSKRAAQLFSHTMKPVKNEKNCPCFACEKIVHVSNASRAARNSFASRMFVTSALDG